MSPSIDTHDVQVKVKKANEFLKDGDKVKISIRFRGREIGHSKVGMQIMEDFAKATEEFGTVDKQPKMEGKSLVMFLAPKNCPAKAGRKLSQNIFRRKIQCLS